MAKNPDLYKKRYKTLKEHQAAVAARKALEGGKNKGPVANAAAYGETLKKPKAKTQPIPKPAAKPSASKPAASTTKPTRSAQANTGTGRDGKFGSGTFGKGRKPDGKSAKPMPSNPKLKSQSRKNLTGRQKIALEVAAASGGKSSAKRKPSGRPVNPKKGETYVTLTGQTMVWTGKTWKQKTK